MQIMPINVSNNLLAITFNFKLIHKGTTILKIDISKNTVF